MLLNRFFLFSILRKVYNDTPRYVIASIKKTLPATFFITVIDIFSLGVLFPFILILLDSTKVLNNPYLLKIYTYLNFNDINYFVLLMMFIVFAVFLIKNILIFLIYRKQTKIYYNVAASLLEERYVNYMRKPYLYHTENNSSSLLRSVAQIPFEFTSGVLTGVNAIINEFILLLIIAIGIFIYNSTLFGLLLIVILPLIYFYNLYHKKTLNYISEERNKAESKIFNSVSQSFEAIREYIVFCKIEFFKRKIVTNAQLMSSLLAKRQLIAYFSPKVIETVAIAAVFFLFLFGFILKLPLSEITGILILYAIAFYRIVPSLNRILLSVNNIRVVMYTFDFLSDMRKESTQDIILEETINFKNEIKLVNVSFKYPNKEYHALNKINFTISKGDRIGIIGPSGSGKSTLLNILLRLFIESEGYIEVDGIKLNETNKFSWYSMVGFVPQNVIIIDGTFIENIAFGIEPSKIDYQLLEEVIIRAQLKDYVAGLSDGYNTRMGERGVKISGGQKQRVGIARALYHKPEILIFDEATSSLDYQTEELLTESINSLTEKSLTIVVVAHRLQTLKYCNRIYKISEGTIADNYISYSDLLSNLN